MSFRVALDIFRGPLDLLLYLVRKHELDILDIPVATIAQQFLAYLEVLQELDVNAVGDFIEMASTLLEIKSRLALPAGEEESEEVEDPRGELVERLLEYKKFRDAASLLEEQGARGRSICRGWPTTCRRGASTRPASRSRRSNCGIWSAPSAASCGTAG